ncbi:MFS transporter [Candidatus Bathyarchaeota archaeon]|jgi:MFS transporter, FSR family, fosmidomycin resistance protein|nr:MFS transporter [Candidatus Bathyarchaeota archaeon]MBT4320424.1 MFS transporter [Candidatus Bathyarchaeota archaeon]MBT4425222.1 MFS transporter [Candidatus Bathyarchaeota archaeon]MBT5642832.1 MFS transporter [Candidatus Bathyarchaeota archaeon]MBT6604356.1 MFS transporter [Candidatus Bathyarchaeota archaeon]
MSEDKGKTYLAYLASSHFVIHVYTFLLPVLLLPFQDELGISLVQLSLLSSIPKLLNVIIYIPTGVISDRYPSRTLTASFAITVVGSLLIPLSNDFMSLLLGFIMLSIGGTLYHPPSLKMASEFSTTKITTAMGIHNMGSSLGFAAGPLLLSIFMDRSSWRHSYYVWTVLTILMTIVTYRYTRGTLKGAETSKSFNVFSGIRNILSMDFALVVAISTLVEAIFMILVTFVPIYFTIEMGLSYSLTSFISGVMPLTGLAGSFLGGYSGDKYGIYKTGMFTMGFLAVLLALFPRMNTLVLAAAVYGLYRSLQAAFMPIINGMITGNSNRENRSLAFSFNFVLVNLLGSISTTGISYVIESRGTPVIFPVSIVMIIPVIGLLWMLQRRSRLANK